MPRRSKVELYEQIRNAHQREEASIRTLPADSTCTGGMSVRRWRRRSRRTASRWCAVAGARSWKPTIDAWLEADRTAPLKQRHTARRVWQRLVDEHGAGLGESSVRRYVAQVRRRQSIPSSK